ncbi:unnamed protein product, partial [Cuscuta europaea]
MTTWRWRKKDEFLQVEAKTSEIEKVGLTLVGTITSESFLFVRDTMDNVWKRIRGVTITEIGARRYMFQFYSENDLTRVLEDRSWTFDLIVLAKLKQRDLPLHVPLNRADFWLQVHDVQ